MLLILLPALHLIAAVFWVGGMAFAYMVLRPAAAALDPAVRLPLWGRVLARFLPWVGVAIATTGIIMMLLYLHLMFAPWRRFRAALDSGALPEAAKRLNQIRIIVGINLLLGVLTLIIGGTGRFW